VAAKELYARAYLHGGLVAWEGLHGCCVGGKGDESEGGDGDESGADIHIQSDRSAWR
jgi:hypothetical protein